MVKSGKTMLRFEAEGGGRSVSDEIVRGGGGLGTFISAFQVIDGFVFGADTRSLYVAGNHQYAMYDVIGHHLNFEIRRERVNVKILVVKRLMMAICGSGDFGYEVHRMLLDLVSDEDSSKRIKGYLMSCMTEVRNKWPHLEESGILAVWYDFDDQDQPTPILFECNSSNLATTVNIVQDRSYSFGGSCDSDILSYVQLHHSSDMTRDAGFRLVHECTSIAAGRANAERRIRATGDDCVGGTMLVFCCQLKFL